MDARETIWWLLSDLFVDTTHTEDDLRKLGAALKETGCGVEDLERILRYEVAPVCGTWMSHPGAIGPWPQFDREDIAARIREYRARPWYRPPLFRGRALWALPQVRREWSIVKQFLVAQ